jgi:hypothetical protein
MSSLISPLQIVRDQFLEERAGKNHLLLGRLLSFVPAAVVAAALLWRDVQLLNAGWLLTATSILTGLTFSMTTTFWGKTIDARDDPKKALNARILGILDDNLHHLQWTVMVGVISTGVLALTSLFADPMKGAPAAVTAVCGALVVYLITLVGLALQRFAEAAVILR